MKSKCLSEYSFKMFPCWLIRFLFEILAVNKILCKIGFLAAKRVFLTDPSWEM